MSNARSSRAEAELQRLSGLGEIERADNWAKYAELIAAEQRKPERMNRR
jgi:hypothetical protein